MCVYVEVIYSVYLSFAFHTAPLDAVIICFPNSGWLRWGATIRQGGPPERWLLKTPGSMSQTPPPSSLLSLPIKMTSGSATLGPVFIKTSFSSFCFSACVERACMCEHLCILVGWFVCSGPLVKWSDKLWCLLFTLILLVAFSCPAHVNSLAS